jgi:hypothetical protein
MIQGGGQWNLEKGPPIKNALNIQLKQEATHVQTHRELPILWPGDDG